MRVPVLLIAPGLVLLTLTACGKAGAPVAPGSNFPRPYPNPNLSPTAAVRAVPEDQAGLSTDNGKAKFTDQGSYIDPAVRSMELSRSAAGAGAGANLLYSTTHNSDGTSTPFNQGLGSQTLSPLPPVPDTTPNTAPDPEPQ